MKFLKGRRQAIHAFFSYRTMAFLVIDAFLIFLSFFVALLLTNNFDVEAVEMDKFFIHLPVAIIIYWVVFEIFQMYRSLWRFASIQEVSKGVIASTVGILIVFILYTLIFRPTDYLVFMILAYFFITSSTIGIRMTYRVYRSVSSYRRRDNKDKKAIVIGAGDAGHLVFDEVNRNHHLDGTIIGFLDDDVSKLGRIVHGVPVLATTENIDKFILERNISDVYIAIPQASQERIRELLNEISKTTAKIKMFPPFYELLEEGGQVSSKLRDARIEDLLGRDVIQLEQNGIKEYIEDKTIVVTGGGGSIGSELVRQLIKFNPAKIIVIDIYENNAYELQMELERKYRLQQVQYMPEIIVLIASVRDEQRMDEIFGEYKPDVVFHAAAHKHVPLMEVSPLEALKNNTVGTYNTALLAEKHGVDKFVLISTDKAVNSTNVMGASKRAAEKAIMKLNEASNTDFAAVRFGNVLGSNGSVIPLFKKQIENGGPVTVTHPKIIRYFMTIPEACQLVIQAGGYAKGGELFILDMGEPVKILDLAVKLIRLSGYEPYKDIGIIFTGLRPGEKMYEELLLDTENSSKTKNDKIFIEKNVFVKRDSEKPILDLIEKVKKDEVNMSEVKTIIKDYISSYKEQ